MAKLIGNGTAKWSRSPDCEFIRISSCGTFYYQEKRMDGSNGWIKCSERMPPHLKTVLIAENICHDRNNREVHDAYWHDSSKAWFREGSDDFFREGEVDYWMPLPEVPNGN